MGFVCWSVACLTSLQHASVSQGRSCSDNCVCCLTEIEIADQIFYLTLSQCTDSRPASLSADPLTPGAWQGSPGITRPGIVPTEKAGIGTPRLPLSRPTSKQLGQGGSHEIATRGVTVSTSAFLACHQCCCEGSGFAWGWNLRALVCGIS